MLDDILTFYIFKSGTNMNWNWTSRDSGKSFDLPALRRFLSMLILFWQSHANLTCCSWWW